MACSSSSSPSSSSVSLAFDGSVLSDVWNYDQVFSGGFERPREGINTIGGFCTLTTAQGGEQQQRVFVKFLSRRVAICAALVDSVKPLFGLLSNGCCVARVRMPDGGADVPWAKRKGAVNKRHGLQWALVTRDLPGRTVTQHLVLQEGCSLDTFPLNRKTDINRELKLPRDEQLVRALVKLLAFRLVFGVADMGLGNFVFDSLTGHAYSIDEGSAFCDSNDPSSGAERTLLTHNLLCRELKQLAVQLGLHTIDISTHLSGVDFSPEGVSALCAQITQLLSARGFLQHESSLAKLVDSYVRPNICSLQTSLCTLLTSESSGKRCRTAIEGASSKRAVASSDGMGSKVKLTRTNAAAASSTSDTGQEILPLAEMVVPE